MSASGAVSGGVAVGVVLALGVAPLIALGLAPGALLLDALGGALGAFESVGWGLVPQLVLAVFVVGLALERATTRAVGLPPAPTPRWLAPAVESALPLGLLGTISGMVEGFVGLAPGALEPGPLVQALGRALRSSLVGFGIALVGVWVQENPEASHRFTAAPAGDGVVAT